MNQTSIIALLLFFPLVFACTQAANEIPNQTALGMEHELVLIFDRQLSVAEVLAAQAQDIKLDKLENISSLQTSLQSRGFLKLSLALPIRDSADVLNVLLFPSRGFEIGQTIAAYGVKHVVTRVAYDTASHREILTLDNGDEVPCGSPENAVTYADYGSSDSRNFYSKTDMDGESVLLEFMYPLVPPFFHQGLGFDNFNNIVGNLRNQEDSYIILVNQFLGQATRQFINYDIEELKKDPEYHLLLQAYRLFLVKDKYNLNIVRVPFDTLYRQMQFDDNNDWLTLYDRQPLQVGSIQMSFTLPESDKPFQPDIWTNQESEKLARSLYAAFVMQWTEPLWIATRISGNLRKGVPDGVHGSYRLFNNKYTAAGSVPLRICGLGKYPDGSRATGHNLYCIDPSRLKHSRSGFSAQCYSLLGDARIARKAEAAIIDWARIDFKGKSGVPNVLDYANGFEYRIFGNQLIENFTPTLEIISLLVAHAEATFFGRRTQDLEYINLDDDALAKTEQCKACHNNRYPCNAWQVATAAVFSSGYRAVLDISFIEALERNLALDFWPKDGPKKVFAFEVADKLVAELYHRYKDNPTVYQMMGHPLAAIQAPQRLGLAEWTYYFDDPGSSWTAQRIELFNAVKSLSGHTVSKQEFLNQVLSKYFDATWTNAYDDVLFYLENKNLVKLAYRDGQILGLTIQ